MFLHLGEDVIVLKKDIIAIFSNESVLEDHSSREFLEIAQNEKKTRKIGEPNKAKAFIITDNCVYISPISSNTLLKRAENIDEMINNWEK